RDLVGERQGSLARPLRAVPGTVEVDRHDPEAFGQSLHQRSPLRARAGARVDAHERSAMPRFPDVRGPVGDRRHDSAVTGSITARTCDTRLHGKPPRAACYMIASGFGARYTQ